MASALYCGKQNVRVLLKHGVRRRRPNLWESYQPDKKAMMLAYNMRV